VDSHSWQQVRAWTYPEFIAERRRPRSAHRSHLVIVRSQTLVGRSFRNANHVVLRGSVLDLGVWPREMKA
jgi:hypothetical protein